MPAALLSYAQTNLYDRTSAILCVPGSKSHPCEIAAIATGVISPRAGMTAESRFGPYGGRYVPETLIPALDELSAAYEEARRVDLDRGQRCIAVARRRRRWRGLCHRDPGEAANQRRSRT